MTPWIVVRQDPLSMGFSRQEIWSGLPLPSPGDFPNLGIEPLVSQAAFFFVRASLVAQMVKRLPTMRETWVQYLGREDLLEKETATHSSILAWKIPWMEEPGRLQSMWSQRVRHDWVTSLSFLPFLQADSLPLSYHKCMSLGSDRCAISDVKVASIHFWPSDNCMDMAL